MNFSSLDFIFLFLPIFVLLHKLTQGALRNALLFAGSTVFYFLAVGGRMEMLFLLLLSAAVNYILGLLIAEGKGNGKKAIFIVGIVGNAVILCLYKYAHSLPASLTSFLSADGTAASILLPLGISFYTFKNISYLHEVYSGKVRAEESLIRYGAYLTTFTQVSMGPIQTYSSMRRSLIKRKVTVSAIGEGTVTFILGLFLKTFFAGRLGGVWNGIETVGYDGISTAFAWLGIVAFSLQLYFDFYGYSLMAEGIGRMLGFDTPKNFDYPYTASSMTDFWRRWHMTLGAWFKENVYFPLGGNRCGKLRHLFNLLTVWLLTGIWHGDTLSFFFWGLFLFAVIAIEKSGILNRVIKHKVWSHVYMIPLILLSWTLFKLPSAADLGVYLSRMFPFFTETPDYVSATDWAKYVRGMGGVVILLGFLFCTPLPRKIFEKLRSRVWIAVPLLLILFWYSVYLSACGANDPFLYFTF